MTGNRFVAFFLRTPLRIFLGDTMLITVTGRKTGRKYSTPVGFYQDGNCLWVLTSRDRTWWRNVRNGADVSLLLRGKTIQAFAQAELEEKSVMAHLQEYIGRFPMARRTLGIRMEDQKPDRVDLARAAKDRLFVKVSLPR